MSVRPFDSSSQYTDWTARNCRGCTKYDPEMAGDCEIDLAVGCALIGDGLVSDEIADRMGYTTAHADGTFPFSWECPERIES